MMNGLTLVGLAIVVFAAGYLVYGRWLTKTWGIDPTAKTPAVEFEDGQDPKSVMKEVLKNCKVVEDDCEIYL